MTRDILLGLIDPDPSQNRKTFDEGALDELAQSMAANGLAVPVLVRPGQDGRYVLVHGERRWRAAGRLGWAAIPAEVRDVAPEQARWLALVENIQRADLSPIEEAGAYQAALSEGLTQTELGKRIGKSQSYIAQKLRLLTLPADVQAALGAGQLSEGQARQLLRLRKDELPHEWISNAARQCLQGGWSVKRLKLQIDFELMVTVPRQWREVDTVGYTFGDLVELEKALEAQASLGSDAPTELWLRVQRALGKHLIFAERLWEEEKVPGLVRYLLEKADLTTLAWGESYHEKYKAYAVGSFHDWLKFVCVPDEALNAALAEVLPTIPELTTAALLQWAIPWGAAYYDQTHEALT